MTSSNMGGMRARDENFSIFFLFLFLSIFLLVRLFAILYLPNKIHMLLEGHC